MHGVLNKYSVCAGNSFYDADTGEYSLHTNLIATIKNDKIIFNMSVINEYPTQTTRSRLYSLIDTLCANPIEARTARTALKEAIANWADNFEWRTT